MKNIEKSVKSGRWYKNKNSSSPQKVHTPGSLYRIIIFFQVHTGTYTHISTQSFLLKILLCYKIIYPFNPIANTLFGRKHSIFPCFLNVFEYHFMVYPPRNQLVITKMS